MQIGISIGLTKPTIGLQIPVNAITLGPGGPVITLGPAGPIITLGA